MSRTKENEDAELAAKMKNAGHDYEFYKQIGKLEELKKLVKQGKVKPGVYQQLESAVFKTKAKKNAPPPGAPQQDTRTNGSFISGVRNLMLKPKKKSPTEQLKDQEPTVGRSKSRSRGLSLRNRTDSLRSNLSKSSRNLRSKKPVALKVIDGELMIFAKTRKRRDWKKVFVVLYQDRVEFFTKQGAKKPSKTVQLHGDFYVSEVRQGILKRATASQNTESFDHPDDERDSEEEEEQPNVADDEILNKPHVFVVSTINQKTKVYLSAESEEKKSFWVTMLVEILREIAHKEALDGDDARPKKMKDGKKIWDDYETRSTAYVQKKLGRSMNPEKVANIDEEKFSENMNRWRLQGNRVARSSVVNDWKSRELEVVKEALKERDLLKRRLQDKDQEFENFKKEKEEEIEVIKTEKDKEIEDYRLENEKWHQKYEELMENYRAEALSRRENNEREEKRLQKQLNSLRRQSVMPLTDQARDYEKEIEMYKKKLETLQKALKIDVDELDWDGTLEQAEEKMKDCLRQIIDGETTAIQQKAQQDFDKWDQLVRNHEDYINRETNKWKSWEDENFEKNIDAKNEMREKFVPEIFLHGCSEKQLIEATGVKQKTAARVRKNKIFKFLWMEPEQIARIHVADLLNNYACQGLDIRELRAVYSSLPKDFQNDNDGGKKQFRENLRNRLFELTRKEKDGKLTSAEELNNAYRDKAVKNNKPKLPKLKREKQVNNKLAGKAAALEAFFLKQGGGGGAPAKPKPAAASKPAAAASKNAVNPDDPEWTKYFKMKKLGLAEGAILQKMKKDGKDPAMWDKLKAAKANGGSGGGATTAAAPARDLDPNDEIWSVYFKMQKLGMSGGQIMNKMQKDGRDPNEWSKLVSLKEKKSAGSAPAKSTGPFEVVSVKPTAHEPAKEKPESAKSESKPRSESKSESKVLAKAKTDIPTTSGEGDHQDLLKDQIKKFKNRKSKTALERTPEEGKKKRKKKKSKIIDLEKLDMNRNLSMTTKKSQRRKTRKSGGKMHFHNLTGNTEDLLKRAQIDVEVDGLANMKRGSHALGGLMEYSEHVNLGKKKSLFGEVSPSNKKSIRKSKGGNIVQIEDTLQEVIDVIVADGYYDEAEGGIKSMKFGELFDKFITISDMLVGLLLKGKKTGQLKYKGDMLFKGIHDEIKITVVK